MFALVSEMETCCVLWVSDQLPLCPPCGGSERRDTAGSEDKNQAVGEQHHSHLPRVLLPLSHLPVSAHRAGAGLQLYRRYFSSVEIIPVTKDKNII